MWECAHWLEPAASTASGAARGIAAVREEMSRQALLVQLAAPGASELGASPARRSRFGCHACQMEDF
jgi:hypothetical protein